ncbi:putative transcription factor GRAS family [Helianthus debilis subsp. tardiflorus]
MDPRFGTSINRNGGTQLNNQRIHMLPDQKPIHNHSFPVYDPLNMYQNSHHFRGLQFDPPTTSSSPIVSSSTENELHEDCDLSDAILGYISQVLMEEDLEDKSCVLYESLDLQAAEKSFYDVLGQKYPPSPSYDEGLFSVDQFIQSPHDSSSLDNNNNAYVGESESPNGMSVSSTSKSNNVIDLLDSPEVCDKDQMMLKFNMGFQEANKFLPAGTNMLTDFNAGDCQLPTGSRVRKGTYEGDEDDQRSVKQAAIFQDATVRSNEIDLILLCSMGQGDVALRLLRNKLRTETGKDMHKDNLPKSLTKGRGKTRGKKPKSKKEVIDLRTLLVTCAQAVATDDRRNASELLKQIRQHASPFGDGNQRLAHCFANGLEARLAGTGSQIHRGLVSKKVSAADYIRAYYLYIGCSPFRKISNFASNRTIMNMAEHATRIHIIDFGILYGFQWPTFIQRISQREGGPPRIRLTGIEFPQPGFRPAETIEETGVRLKEYAKKFNVSFEYKSIAKRWENVSIEDLKIDENEFLVVNCMYRSKNLLDETVGVDSARNVVLDLIRKISPNIFIHGILNGSYNAPFFLTRFKEALFHFSALFDMLETNVPRERSERKLLEGEVFGREALNVIACEGWERIERPETYKQWHVRNLRAGFVSVPFSREIIKLAKEKVGLYHKDFMIDVDNDWLLQGWKGRIIYAMSCWKAA